MSASDYRAALYAKLAEFASAGIRIDGGALRTALRNMRGRSPVRSAQMLPTIVFSLSEFRRAFIDSALACGAPMFLINSALALARGAFKS